MNQSHQFTNLTVAAGRAIVADGKSWLFFGGTAYLSLTQHPAFMELYLQGMRTHGVNYGTSRNNNVQCGIYEAAEQCAAARFGAESALITSSGFLAARLAVEWLAHKGELLYAPDCHPALWLRERPHTTGDFNEWAARTVEYINSSEKSNFVIISNTINNLVPEQYDFSVFKHIRENRQVYFLLDHSHGIGVLPTMPRVPAGDHLRVCMVASMAKGLGLDAGVLLSDKATIESLKQSPIFLGASPPAPAAMYAFIHGNEIYQQQLARLQENTLFFRENIRQACRYTPGFPVFYFPETGLYDRLLHKNIIISAFPYPLPTSPLLNRVVISSGHTQSDMEQLLAAIHGDN
jgi:8-amino-7-oxononanoate synthase